MGLFKRVGDIVSANLNELVDRFEDPETMLRHAVAEMEQAIARAMDGAARVIANERLLAGQLDEQHRKAEQWRKRAEEAVGRGDDDAARHSLSRKREHERLAAALKDQHAAAEQAGRKLRRQIDAMRARLAEARRKQLALAARQRAARAQKTMAACINHAGIDDAAFSRFDRMSQRVEQTEAEAEAWLELSGLQDGADLDDPDDADIETELEALKRQGTTSK